MCVNMKSIDQQCIETIKLLELNSGIYDLKIDDIPVWWFVRFRFYEKLYNFLSLKEKKEIYFYSPLPLKEIITQNYKQIIFFFFRAILGVFSILINRKKEKIMFFTYPQNKREWRNGKKIDSFMDIIFERLIDKSIIVEQMALNKSAIYNPFNQKRKTIFFDGAMMIAIFKSIFNLYRKPKISNWDEFKEKCQKINFQDVPSEWIIETIKEFIISNRNKVLIQIEAARIIINKLKPKLIIETVNYNSGTMALNYIARKFSIPIVELQHGLINKFHLGYIYFSSQNQKNKILPNKILVYGDFFKKCISGASNAFSPEEIKVVGFLRLNNFLKENQSKKEIIRRELRDKLGINNDNFLITITSDMYSSVFLINFIKNIIPLLGEKITICIKLHPMDNEKKEREIYKEITDSFHIKILTDDIVDLYQLLVSSDMHVTIYSTVFFECLALGVPNIIIDADEKFSSIFPEIADRKEIIKVDNPDDFINKIKEFIANNNFKNEYINIGKKLANCFFNTKEDTEEEIIKEINRFLI